MTLSMTGSSTSYCQLDEYAKYIDILDFSRTKEEIKMNQQVFLDKIIPIVITHSEWA
jgi:hypothetical protein